MWAPGATHRSLDLRGAPLVHGGAPGNGNTTGGVIDLYTGTAGERPIITAAYTDVANYNNDFAIRQRLTKFEGVADAAKSFFTYRVPLSRILGIHNDIKHVWRGTKHRLELRRAPIGEQVFGTGADRMSEARMLLSCYD